MHMVQNVFPKIVADLRFNFCPKEIFRGKPSHQIGFKNRRFNAQIESALKEVTKMRQRPTWARTHDPEIKSLMLYRLS